jgi:peptidyl-prolyl cis-trans isomerase SDCCAG10
MAGADRNDNRSQFFITLAPRCDELDGQHTIFGKVVGNTLFNVLEASTLELVPGTDRPVCPPRILAAQIVANPFEDIVPRMPKKQTKREALVRPGVVASRKLQVKVLSFDDEELDGLEDDGRGTGGGSGTGVFSQAKFVQKKAEEDSEEFDRKMRESLMKKRKAIEETSEQTRPAKEPKKEATVTEVEAPSPIKQARPAVDEDAVLARLAKFRSRIASSSESGNDWLGHQLVFDKRPDETDPMTRKDGEYVAYDPRLHQDPHRGK